LQGRVLRLVRGLSALSTPEPAGPARQAPTSPGDKVARPPAGSFTSGGLADTVRLAMHVRAARDTAFEGAAVVMPNPAIEERAPG